MKTSATSPARESWSALDLAEGFHLAHALWALEQSGILASLDKPVAVDRLARRHGVDRHMLDAVLRLLAARTGLLTRQGSRYRTTAMYDSYARSVLRQYLGAYGENVRSLGRILHDPSLAVRLIDRCEHARAFAETTTLGSVMVVNLVAQLGLNNVLDLGCGSGTMLLDLAGRVPDFVGWGLDINPHMCAAARKSAARAGVGKQISIVRGDCRVPDSALSRSVIGKVETITAVSLANEFFAKDGAAVDWLSRLKTTFPGRAMLIADYYGCIGRRREPWPREIALHDFVQVISGQGVPPPTLSAWKKIYRTARYTLLHAVEDRGATCFVHLVRL